MENLYVNPPLLAEREWPCATRQHLDGARMLRISAWARCQSGA